MNTFSTPDANSEDIPERVITLKLHLSEALQIRRAVDYFCATAKRGFDSAPYRYELRDVLRVLHEATAAHYEELDEAAEFIEPKPPSPKTVVREVHHHHYHSRPRPGPNAPRQWK